MSVHTLATPPSALVGPDGSFPFGNFAGPFPSLNFADFDFRLLDRFPQSLSRAWSSRLLKRWQFVGVVDDHFAFGAAVVHLNYLGTGFAYLYDRDTRTVTEFNLKSPLAIGTRYSDSPASGVSSIRRGDRVVAFDNTVTDGKRGVHVDFPGELVGDVTLSEPGVGVSTLCPKSGKGFHYTYKSAGLLPEGTFVLGGKTYETSANARALLDWTASTPPRLTCWNWACGVGRDQHQRSIGLNVSRGLVGDGYSQNAVWVDGVPHLAAEVRFDFDRGNLLGKPWSVTTADGVVDLVFRPEVERSEDVNLGVVVSRFHQPFGRFEGTLRLPGETLQATLFGVCEDHVAKW